MTNNHPDRPPAKKFQMVCPRTNGRKPALICGGRTAVGFRQRGKYNEIIFTCDVCGHDVHVDIGQVEPGCLLQKWFDDGKVS